MLGAIAQPSRKNLPFLKQYKNKHIFLFYLIFIKIFYMWINGASVLAYGPKPCCKLLFNGFLPSAVPYWNWCKLLTCYYNLSIHIVFSIFSCRTLNNFDKPSSTIFFLPNCRKNWKLTRNSNLRDFKISFSGNYIHVRFIS